MNPRPHRATITVRNRQRVLEIDTRLLKQVAQHALTLAGTGPDSLRAPDKTKLDLWERRPRRDRADGIAAGTPLPHQNSLSLVGVTREIGGLSLVLVDDRAIARLNARFHHTAGPTDVLSFDYGGGVGELIVSVERARAQARRYRTTTARELALYVVHGILHLCGYDDRTPRQRATMRAAERRLLARLARAGLSAV